ncbi:Hypothetical predicted protein [Mytilus galloprovincialis]|uniref:CCHC-type domain-containing protein n=1 Tax=Mytilus galloprovincialis TaxID=29158 RepID=A0A8B6G9Z5_MYTGA|nr:Hypothetical predicted protein [Mytilus galloprovincialis]
MNSKLGGIERNLDSLAKKVKKAEITFRFKGNQIQFELNSDIIDGIDRAVDYIDSKRPARATKLLEETIKTHKKRNKLIRIADMSEGEWNTVQEYLSDDVASNSENEKRIRAAEVEQLGKLRRQRLRKNNAVKDPLKQQEHLVKVHIMAGALFLLFLHNSLFVTTRAKLARVDKAGDMCYSCATFWHLATDCRAMDKKFGYRGGAI